MSPVLAKDSIPIQAQAFAALEDLKASLSKGLVSTVSLQRDREAIGCPIEGDFTGCRIALCRAFDGDSTASTAPLRALEASADRPASAGQFEGNQIIRLEVAINFEFNSDPNLSVLPWSTEVKLQRVVDDTR